MLSESQIADARKAKFDCLKNYVLSITVLPLWEQLILYTIYSPCSLPFNDVSFFINPDLFRWEFRVMSWVCFLFPPLPCLSVCSDRRRAAAFTGYGFVCCGEPPHRYCGHLTRGVRDGQGVPRTGQRGTRGGGEWTRGGGVNRWEGLVTYLSQGAFVVQNDVVC